MTELKVYKICSHCNVEFELKIRHGRGVDAYITTFEDCPHCGKRNDTWLRIPAISLLEQPPASEFSKRVRWIIRDYDLGYQPDLTDDIVDDLRDACDLIDSQARQIEQLKEDILHGEKILSDYALKYGLLQGGKDDLQKTTDR